MLRDWSSARYEMVRTIASGGTAEIVLARDRWNAGQHVAVKRIHEHLAHDPTSAEMILDEARIMSRLVHPNVVRVLHLLDNSERPSIVMELLEGVSLAELLSDLAREGRRLDPCLTAHIVAHAARGLDAAHDLRDDFGHPLEVVHRDVSPQNLFLTTEGCVKVLDFGIASALNRQTRTETGVVKGKLRYMAPEQLEGVPLDRRADVFALGIVLYEAAAMRPLFRRDDAGSTVRAVLEEPLPDITAQLDGDEDLAAICRVALERDRTRRFSSADEMRRALELYLRRRQGPRRFEAEIARLCASASPRAPRVDTAAPTPTPAKPTAKPLPAPKRPPADVPASTPSVGPTADADPATSSEQILPSTTRVKGQAFRSWIRAFRALYGEQTAQDLLRQLPEQQRLLIVRDQYLAAGLYPVGEYAALLAAAQSAAAGAISFARTVSREAVNRDLDGLYAFMLKLTRPETIARHAERLISTYYKGLSVAYTERFSSGDLRIWNFTGATSLVWQDLMGGIEAVLERSRRDSVRVRILSGGGDKDTEAILRIYFVGQ